MSELPPEQRPDEVQARKLRLAYEQRDEARKTAHDNKVLLEAREEELRQLQEALAEANKRLSHFGSVEVEVGQVEQ